jgi:hypothetical protein
MMGEQATELVHIGLMTLLRGGGASDFQRACFNVPTLRTSTRMRPTAPRSPAISRCGAELRAAAEILNRYSSAAPRRNSMNVAAPM